MRPNGENYGFSGSPRPRNHSAPSGDKAGFLRNEDTPTAVTQVAYGVFDRSDYCDMHRHPTMEECFFFLKGIGIYTVGDEQISLQPGVFVRIPAGVLHRLEATGADPLEYVYFGVATDQAVH